MRDILKKGSKVIVRTFSVFDYLAEAAEIMAKEVRDDVQRDAEAKAKEALKELEQDQ